VQGPSTRRETEQQRTRRIFILGIVLNRLSICARLSNFLFADVPLDYTPESVATKFKLASGKLPPNILKRFHLAGAWMMTILQPTVNKTLYSAKAGYDASLKIL
jgi:hypothetical protein